MTEAQEFQRRLALAKSGGRCEICGQPLGSKAQGAHRIANTEANRRHWGSWIIDSPLNIAMTCSLKCNDACNIGNNPGKCLELAEQILLQEICRFNYQHAPNAQS